MASFLIALSFCVPSEGDSVTPELPVHSCYLGFWIFFFPFPHFDHEHGALGSAPVTTLDGAFLF